MGYQLFIMPNRFKATNEKLVNVGIEREKKGVTTCTDIKLLKEKGHKEQVSHLCNIQREARTQNNVCCQ